MNHSRCSNQSNEDQSSSDLLNQCENGSLFDADQISDSKEASSSVGNNKKQLLIVTQDSRNEKNVSLIEEDKITVDLLVDEVDFNVGEEKDFSDCNPLIIDVISNASSQQAEPTDSNSNKHTKTDKLKKL